MVTRRSHSPAYFDDAQIRTIAQLTDYAEQMISAHYKIGHKEWRLCRYDLRTQHELREEKFAESALAQITKAESLSAACVMQEQPYELYHICLHDAAILHILDERQARADFAALMLYILTHEMVHIVRFSRMQQAFSVAPWERSVEEARVHKITHDILRPLSFQRLDTVLRNYAGFYNQAVRRTAATNPA